MAFRCIFGEKLYEILYTFFRETTICRVTQNLRYQYIMVILWVVLVSGIFISCLGLINFLYKIGKARINIDLPWVDKKSLEYRASCDLTCREMDYLEKIKELDFMFYNDVLKELMNRRLNEHQNNADDGGKINLLSSIGCYDNEVEIK